MPSTFKFYKIRKKTNERAEKSRRITLILDKISEIKKRKLNVEHCIASLKSDVEKYVLEAEEKEDLTLLSKARFGKQLKTNFIKNFMAPFHGWG